ncbi:MAG: DegT/DnrJ/EryC1/StrS family aminotransferase [bacterium]
MSRNQKSDKDEVGRIWVQTGVPQFKDLDRWQQVGEEEARLVYEMTLRNELSGGTPVVREFENQWRESIGSRYCLSVMNGSSALYSAYFGLGVGPGDEVICPTYTWICTIAPATLLGARPVFAESDPDTLLLDPEDVKKRITEKTQAIVVVHLWGLIADMDALMRISEDTGIPIIEDCSHAHGARYKGRMCGKIGAAGCWSFQGSKPVSGGEAGILVTDDQEVFERACLLGQVNRIAGVDLVTERYTKYQPLGIGMKYRSHPLGIAIAKVQLGKLEELNRRRREYVEAIENGIEEIPGLRPVKQYEGVERAGFYGFPIHHIPDETPGLSTEELIKRIVGQGIPANGDPYGLLHRLPLYAEGFDLFTRNRGPLCGDYKGYKEGDFPVTETMTRHLIFLPMCSDPAPGAVEFVLDGLRKALAPNRAD